MLNVVPVKVKGGVSEGVRGSFGRGDVCSVTSGFGDVVEVGGRMWGSHPPRFVPCSTLIVFVYMLARVSVTELLASETATFTERSAHT